MMARLKLSPLINYKLDLDQKRRRNASICINSPFVVTIRIDWYVSVSTVRFPNVIICFQASGSKRFNAQIFASFRKSSQRCVS